MRDTRPNGRVDPEATPPARPRAAASGPRIPVARHHRTEFVGVRLRVEVADQETGALLRRPRQQHRELADPIRLILPIRRQVRHDHRDIRHRRDAHRQTHTSLRQSDGARRQNGTGSNKGQVFGGDVGSTPAHQALPVVGDPRSSPGHASTGVPYAGAAPRRSTPADRRS